MKIGIIGAGAIGSAIARALANAKIDAVIANSRGPASLAHLEADLGTYIRAATVEEAARSDIVFLAANWSKIPAAVQDLPSWDGRIVIDANNPIEAPAFQPFDLGGRTSSDIVASLLPGARVVKAFNHLRPALLSGDPRAEGGHRVLFVAGDDAAAKNDVMRLIGSLGFSALDTGALADGGQVFQFPGGPLSSLNLVRFD